MRIVLAVVALGWVVPVWAAPPTRGEIVTATKPCVALIEKAAGNGRATVTAFAVSADEYLLTLKGALPLQGPGAKLTVVLNPGDAGQKEVTATIVRTDSTLDLALLKADTTDPLPHLTLADADPVEKDELLAFYFPEPRGKGQADHPPVTVAAAVAGKPPADPLRSRVEFKVTGAGVAGAPVVDATGKVATVMVFRDLIGLDVSAALPASRVRQFLERPEITLTAPAVAPKERFDPKGVHRRAEVRAADEGAGGGGLARPHGRRGAAVPDEGRRHRVRGVRRRLRPEGQAQRAGGGELR